MENPNIHNSAVAKPPILDGSNYAYWKTRMKAYLKSQNNQVWLSVVNGYTEPTSTVDGKNVRKPYESWTNGDHQNETYNSCALNAIFGCVSLPEFQRIFTCEIAKGAWDILAITHERNSPVRQQKLQSIITKFEMIRMKDNETFGEFYARLSEVVNSSFNLGEPISSEKIIKKIMRSLPERFITKVEVLECMPNFDSMKVEEIVGHLLTFETKLSQYRPQKEKNKNERNSFAFSSFKDSFKVPDSDDDELDQEEMALFVKKFGKFFKKNKTFGPNSKDKNGRSSKGKERKESKSSGLQCYECMGFGHIAQECANKQKNKSYNVKTWDDSDSNEEENCGGSSKVMALGASVHPHVSESKLGDERVNDEYLSNSESEEEESLQKAYNELYKESLRLTNIELSSEEKKSDESNVKLKQELLKAQARVSQVENDTDSLINELVDVKSVNANLQVELDKANATFKKMNAGSKALEEIIGVQRRMSNKTGLGFQKEASTSKGGGNHGFGKHKGNHSNPSSFICGKKNNNAPRKPTPPSPPMQRAFIPICHHCGVNGHIRPHCYQLIGHPHAHSNIYDKSFWGSTHKHMPTHKTNVIHQSKPFPKAKAKVEKVRIRTLWVRSSDVRPQVNHTCISLDDNGSSGKVNLVF
ncbi:uncharacterized protein LOC131328504 [Rhododendron vialii]|uniref:uncharacterized protein LOC131328504 n=1 Tax=Rhododendron vialii TaxID=182163 RepID=UPI00265F382C|nr:uncharacterized protein LOC131328504 [Rhododendron vialii]